MDANPSIFTRILEFGGTLLAYWWLLVPGGVLVIEPAIETLVPERSKASIDRWWPRRKRHMHVRWAAVAAMLIASFLAFDEVNLRNRSLQRDVDQLTGERDAARLEAARKEHTGTVQPKDRGKFVRALQQFYVFGHALQANLLATDISDNQIDGAELDVQNWLNATGNWIQRDMSVAAASRFLNNTDKATYGFGLVGDHGPGEKDKRDRLINILAGCLTNLETLMKSDQWDP